VLASGTYTPTLTLGLNLMASTPSPCQWMRVGNVVTVSGLVTIDPASASIFSSLYISLPVASNFTANDQCAGAGSGLGFIAAGLPCAGILADTAGDRAEFVVVPPTAVNHSYAFTFTYQIL